MPTFETVDDYQTALGEPARSVLAELRSRVAAVVPGVEEVISYDMPTFALDGRRLFLAACWKQHLSVYPVPEPTTDDPGLADDLAPHISGASTLKLPYRAGIPWPLVERVARAHVAR
ncbi:MAG: DUF1801 domain-containing protein [Nocardioidaceae bacterium]